MSTMGVAFLAAPRHDDLRDLQVHWVNQSLMKLKFRRYLARARARTALVNVGPPALTHKGRAFKALPGDFLLNFVHFQRADFHSLCIDFVFKMIILKENY